jgi:hypothetical protein
MLVNEACYSGAWTPITDDIGNGRDVLIETASQAKEFSYNFRSASGRYRCSLFACAYIYRGVRDVSRGQGSSTLLTYQGGDEACEPHENTSMPSFLTSSRSLLSRRLSHFMLIPSIADSIVNIASEQTRYEI